MRFLFGGHHVNTMNAEWIATQTSAATIADHILADDQEILTYAQLDAGLAELDEQFAAVGVAAEDSVLLATANRLAAVRGLLYLLERGYDTVLLPEDRVENPAASPAFCRWRLEARSEDKDTTRPAALHLAPNPGYRAACALPPDAPRLMLQTSGSTGTPKLAVHHHRGLRQNALRCVERFRLHADDRVALPVPIYHMFGLGAGLLPALAAGASVNLQAGANLLRFNQHEQTFNPTVAFMTPAFATSLLQIRRTPRPYRLTVTAGDRFRADRLDRYEHAFGPVVQLYGSTEQGAIAAATPELPITLRQRTAGTAMTGVELRVAAPEGEPGELLCRRDDGFIAYLDYAGGMHPSGHRADGWWPTRDFARLDSAGHLEVLGRSDHSVNRDGVLVFFAEIERVIEALDTVAMVAVTADTQEGPRGRRLIAHCLARTNTELSPAQIRAHCLAQLPRRAVPDDIRLVEHLPLLANGKLDRSRLATTPENPTTGEHS